jgi:hypothetical protein
MLYRQNAKPRPPEKFHQRVTTDASKHIFSNHDNREAILTDACVFDYGIGKRKAKPAIGSNITAWQETVEDGTRNSTYYQRDFCHFFSEKLLTGRKNVETRALSNYRHSYNSDQIESDDYKSSRIEKYRRYIQIQNLQNIQNRPKTSASTSGVASCLVWHDKLERSSNSMIPIINKRANDTQAEVTNSRPKTVAVCNIRSSLAQNSSTADANNENEEF